MYVLFSISLRGLITLISPARLDQRFSKFFGEVTLLRNEILTPWNKSKINNHTRNGKYSKTYWVSSKLGSKWLNLVYLMGVMKLIFITYQRDNARLVRKKWKVSCLVRHPVYYGFFFVSVYAENPGSQMYAVGIGR